MSSSISVNGVGKAYKIYPTRWSRLREWLAPGGGARHQLRHVLQDISFQVQPGQALALVGINGAGKSTLLKIITGTTRATTGSVAIGGRVAALLELGMGFHPEFTGRQNAFMAGQLLGYSPEEITRLMPEIEEFAEIGDYIDQQVRVYSSGMQVRLAFSVATAIRPDVLIVDEALSVGDVYFQHKSFERIREFKQQGTTLLIVSHDRQAIQGICDRAILLSEGRMLMDADPEAVMDYYNAMLAQKDNQQAGIEQQVREDGRSSTRSGTGEAQVVQVALFNQAGEAVETINVGEQVKLRVRLQVNAALPDLVFGYMIKDRLGQVVFGTNTHYLDVKMQGLQAGEVLELELAFAANLGVGSYSVTVALHTRDSHLEHNFDWQDLAMIFSVININREHFAGISWLPPSVEFVEKRNV